MVAISSSCNARAVPACHSRPATTCVHSMACTAALTAASQVAACAIRSASVICASSACSLNVFVMSLSLPLYFTESPPNPTQGKESIRRHPACADSNQLTTISRYALGRWIYASPRILGIAPWHCCLPLPSSSAPFRSTLAIVRSTVQNAKRPIGFSAFLVRASRGRTPRKQKPNRPHQNHLVNARTLNRNKY